MIPANGESIPAAETLTPFVQSACSAVTRDYPCHYSVLLAREQDLQPPRLATPAFRGSFDWHSAVHGHWCLVRALRQAPGAPWSAQAMAALDANLTEARLEAEFAFVSAPGREGFERPYGLAWVLQLAAELRGWNESAAQRWSSRLAPLERLAASRLAGWLERLPWPVRSGEHSQSAFAAGLLADWARDSGQAELGVRVASHVLRLYAADRGAPVDYEPSGQDFLSPALGEADLLRRVMSPADFAAWLAGFLPSPGSDAFRRWLVPVASPDRGDGKFAHLDGLNLSRAWMLEGIVSGLPAGHAHAPALAAAAAAHRQAGLAGAATPHYAGSHWLGSFAIYLLTRRGMA